MRITKCDICKKEIKRADARIDVSVSARSFDSFEFCSSCGKAIIKILKDKKLIDDKKYGK